VHTRRVNDSTTTPATTATTATPATRHQWYVRTRCAYLPVLNQIHTSHASAGRNVLVWTDLQYRTGILLHTLFPYPWTLFPYPVIVTPGCFRSALNPSQGAQRARRKGLLLRYAARRPIYHRCLASNHLSIRRPTFWNQPPPLQDLEV
jgi:hypothetical protein